MSPPSYGENGLAPMFQIFFPLNFPPHMITNDTLSMKHNRSAMLYEKSSDLNRSYKDCIVNLLILPSEFQKIMSED